MLLAHIRRFVHATSGCCRGFAWKRNSLEKERSDGEPLREAVHFRMGEETMFTPTVKWVIAVILVVDVALLCYFIRFRIKRNRSSAFFDFDLYKERELLRRHVMDRSR